VAGRDVIMRLELELGTSHAATILAPRLEALAEEKTIVIGGPPCQAYSVVGRNRNRGTEGYEASKDHRHFLYKEYIGILKKTRPVAFVMENVKGILSSKVDGVRILDLVLRDLKDAGGTTDSYKLVALDPQAEDLFRYT
jgi:DNA (cytosine-5)-methyltransferase 1